MNVLILEDEFLLAMMLGDEVSDAGHTVLGPASTVTDALRLAEATPPDLALLNIMLSGGDRGADAAVVLKDRWNVPCLFVSGSRAIAEEYRFAAVGILEKPYTGETIREVLKVLGNILESRPIEAVPLGLTLFHEPAGLGDRRSRPNAQSDYP